jgi:hypothetical protein
MGQLNIKDEAVIAEARLLAEELGTSVTGALRAAIAAMREQRARAARLDTAARIRRIEAIAERASALVPPQLRTSEHADLYDDHGAPR